jgi:hypothetical protein
MTRIGNSFWPRRGEVCLKTGWQVIGATQPILRTLFASQTLSHMGQSFVMANLRSNGCRPKFLRSHGAVSSVMRSAGFQTCCVADFQVAGRTTFNNMRVWKPAILKFPREGGQGRKLFVVVSFA